MDGPTTWQHTPVLLHETIDAIVTRPDGVYVDGTFGRGGHARALLERLAPSGRLIAFDKDPEAVQAAASIVDARFSIVHSGFARMAAVLPGLGVGLGQVTGVMLDLGVSSPQIDNPARDSAFASMRRWTCAWTRPAATPPRIFCFAPMSAR